MFESDKKVMRLLQILRAGSILLLCAGLVACQSVARVDKRGYVQSRPVDERIVVGQSSREDVRDWLGSPSTVSSFPPETWYYISRQKETVAFLEPDLVEQQVVRIEFNAEGKVSNIENFMRDAVREVQYVDRETPTEGRSLGLMEQLLGNLGRFNTPRDASAATDRQAPGR